MRITMDNINLMKRISSMKSFYNSKDVYKMNYKHQELLEMHCEYPLVIEEKMESRKNQKSTISSHKNQSVVYLPDPLVIESEKQQC